MNSSNEIKLSSYTIFPSEEPEILEISFEEQVISIRDVLLQATRYQIDTEQQTAAFLSGGMDTSTNIAILVEKLGLRPIALTATFQEKTYDELESARVVVEKFGLEHLIVPIKPELIVELPKIVKLYENPHGDRSIFAEYFLCAAARANGCKQLVTGEGGDEILGYPRSRDGDSSLELLPAHPRDLAHLYLDLTSMSPPSVWRKLLERLGVDWSCGYVYLETLYKQYIKYTSFERLYIGQWRTWLIDGVYMKDIRVSNHFQLQLVHPFMDSILMRYMSQLPFLMKKDGLAEKSYLKTAMRGVLPEQTLLKTKQKFWLPFPEWFRADIYSYLRDTLLRANSFVCDQFGGDVIYQLIDAHKAEESDHSRILWSLLFLEVWYYEFAHKWVQGRY